MQADTVEAFYGQIRSIAIISGTECVPQETGHGRRQRYSWELRQRKLSRIPAAATVELPVDM